MENIINKYSIANAINIIGDAKQVLQIALKRNTAIVINKKYVSYISSSQLEDKPYHEELFNIKSTTPKIKTNELIKLRNVKDSIEYIGLTNQGRIIKIIPIIYNNLFIRLNTVLAFSDSVNLINDDPVQATLMSFFRKIPRNKLFNLPMFYLIQSPSLPLISNTDVSLNSLILLREGLYLSSNGAAIEKRLGENESITININGLIAFEKSVSFSSMTSNKISYFSRIEDVIVSGPGLIIFEKADKTPKINKMSLLMMIAINLLFITFLILDQLYT